MTPSGTTFRIAFVGDVALGNHPKTPGFGFLGRYFDEIPASSAQYLRQNWADADIVFGNYEFPISNPGYNLTRFHTCLGANFYAAFIKEAGFTVLNVANNHMWEHGATAFRHTVTQLRDVGLKVIGVGDDFREDALLDVRGTKVAFLAWSDRPRQGFSETPDYNELDMDRCLASVVQAKARADVVVVSMHWGEEFVTLPSDRERRMARLVLDAGASVVVGHHPHVLREVETDGRSVVAYSLGNFIGDMTWNEANRESGCLFVDFHGLEIKNVEFLPAFIEDDYFPRFAEESTRANTLAFHEKRRSRQAEQIQSMGYEKVCRSALRQHQILTLGLVLRNLHRYRPSFLVRMVAHVLRSRIPGGDR